LLFGSVVDLALAEAEEAAAGAYDMAAMLTPVLLEVAVLSFSCPCAPSFFAASCLFEDDDLPLLWPLEKDNVETDLSSLALLAESLLAFAFALAFALASAGALARALASLALVALMVLGRLGVTFGDG